VRVLVTGASGHVGGAIARHLLASGHAVVGVSRRSMAPAGVEAVALDLGGQTARADADAMVGKCDAIVHAAARLDKAPDLPDIVTANCLATQQLLALARDWEARFVFISGVAVIGRPATNPITEEHPVRPATAYHASKVFGEQLADIAASSGQSTISLRLTAPVGPGQPRTRILSVFVERALLGQPLPLAGEGTRRQNFVDVRDVGVAVELSLSSRAAGVFNVGGSASVSNLELADTCISTLASKSRVELTGAPDPEEGLVWEVSSNRAAETLGYMPSWSIEDSIIAVADDIRSSPSPA
jgi:nucleoside-diphosphate-sugar epimerase